MQTYDKGSVPLIEVKFEQYTAYEGYAYFDPSTSAITIYQPGKTPKFDGVALEKSAKGKYYYKCQTADGWDTGDYWAKVVASDGSVSDTKRKKVFALK